MLREVWRLQRDQFWVADMSGVDWDAVYAALRAAARRASRRAASSPTSSGRCRASSARRTPTRWAATTASPPPVALGHLGARRRARPTAASGYEITRIVARRRRGTPAPIRRSTRSASRRRSASASSRSTASRVSRERPPQALLVHQAGAEGASSTLAGGRRQRATRTRASSRRSPTRCPARYREWVERNRAWVHEQSDGRVGYFHVPDMRRAGFAEFHRYFSGECDRDALIVDVRYNRGGHVSQLLLEKVARKRIGYDLLALDEAGAVSGRGRRRAGGRADQRARRLRRRHLLAQLQADGHRPAGRQAHVGRRRSASGRGTRWSTARETTQPEFSFWFSDVGWGVENYGTDPDIEVDNAPQDAAARPRSPARDGAATALELRGQERRRIRAPRVAARPVLARGKLPPRA